MTLQSGILAIGAWLVIHQEATGGIIIAELDHDRPGAGTDRLRSPTGKVRRRPRRAGRGCASLGAASRSCDPACLCRRRTTLSVEAISMAPPGQRSVVVQDALRAEKGAGLGIIGPSASGKSSLARAIAGIGRRTRGTVRLDGATLDQWSPEELGSHIGYLPQECSCSTARSPKTSPVRAPGRRTRSWRRPVRRACMIWS